MANVRIEHFFHPDSFTYTYVVAEEAGEHCVIIDSALDYDPKSGDYRRRRDRSPCPR